MRKFRLREVKEFTQDPVVRVVGSRFRSENVCLRSPHFYYFLLTSTNSGISFDGGEEANWGIAQGRQVCGTDLSF